MTTSRRNLIGVLVVATILLSACGGASNSNQSESAMNKSSARNIPDLIGSTKLNPHAPPGKNFDLSGFTLQLPTGSPDNVDTVTGAELEGGYSNRAYFFTDTSDGAMVLMDPKRGWTTSGSQHPRSELREDASWSTSGTNILDGLVSVTQVPDHTTVAQIFQASGPSKPLCELQVNANGTVDLLLEASNQGGNGTRHPIGSVTIGKAFPYQLSLKGSVITVIVNGQTSHFTIDSSFRKESFYFKAGDYDQTAVAGSPLSTPGTVVKYFSLKITH